MMLPQELVEQFARGNGVIFVGAGLSTGAGLPTWAQLVTKLADDLIDCPSESNYLDIAQYYEIEHGRHQLVQALRDRLDASNLSPTPAHRELITIPTRAIFTTNYDDLIERTFRESETSFSLIVTNADVTFWSTDRTQLVKVHGDLHQPDSIVITSQDYEHFENLRPTMGRLLSTILHTSTVLFLGYSVSDPDLRLVLAQNRLETGRLTRNLYSVQFNCPRLKVKDLESRGIRVIEPDMLAGDRSQALSQWLQAFTKDIASQAQSAKADLSSTVSVEGRINRTKRIIRTIEVVISDVEKKKPEEKFVRLRQGFTAFSLGPGDHPGEPDYQRLLMKEKEMFVKLLDAGFTIKALIAKRPIFAGDMFDISAQSLLRWRTWLSRCRNLIDFIEQAQVSGKDSRLLFVPSSRPHMNDFSIGKHVLVKGVKSTVGASYDLTLFTTDPVQVCTFNDEFDDQFLKDQAAHMSGSEPRTLLHICLATLREHELEIRSRVELLEIAMSGRA